MFAQDKLTGIQALFGNLPRETGSKSTWMYPRVERLSTI